RAVALEHDAFLEHNDRRLEVTRHARPARELHPLARVHVADELAVHHEGAGADDRVHHTALADDQRVRRGDLALELAVQQHGAGERVLALDLGAFVHEGGELLAGRGGGSATPGPHGGELADRAGTPRWAPARVASEHPGLLTIL